MYPLTVWTFWLAQHTPQGIIYHMVQVVDLDLKTKTEWATAAGLRYRVN